MQTWGGGFQRGRVVAEHHFLRSVSSGDVFGRIMTNTTCAYLMDIRLAEEAEAYLRRFPLRQLVAIDTFVNYVSTELSANGPQLCLHADPLPFQHGSMTGDLKSWRQ